VEEKMKKGFSLIEIMLAILLVCIISTSAVKLLMASSRAGTDSSTRTYASILANSKLVSLKSCPLSVQDIAPGWHADKENPLVNSNKSYYRYWTVTLNSNGTRTINVHVKWDNSEGAPDVSSQEDMANAQCLGVQHTCIRDALMP
jgi:prepilin-type N-terminal cleavage/methylation domain-containing protein